MLNFLKFFTLLMALNLIGCGATLPKIKPFKMDIQQGNVVTSEMLLKLRPGMTKSQVKFIMGTPLLVDSFRTNRWDYFYQLRKQGKIVSQRRVILDFEKDLLKRVRGDVVPKGKTAEDVTKELEQEAKEQKNEEVVSEKPDNPDLLVEPMETPAIESTQNTTDSALSESSAEVVDSAEPTSVLAVPVEAADVLKETSEAEAAVAEKTKDVVDAAVSEPTEEAKNGVLPEVEVESEASAPTPTAAEALPVVDSVSASDAGSEVLTVMPTKVDDKLIFRMDRSLDTTRIVPQEVSASKAPLQDSVVQEVEEAKDGLPLEEPSFFERMLEKIGF